MSSQTLIQAQPQELAEQKNAPGTIENGSQPPADVPVNYGAYTKGGMIFLLFTLGIFSLWAGLAPLSSAIIGDGKVVVDSNRKSIQHFEGGIIRDIMVRNGDWVEAGDPLIQLETVQWEAELKSNYDRMLGIKAELERLIAEQQFATELKFSEELKAAATQNADIASILAQQGQLHRARINAFLQQKKALENNNKQIEQQRFGLEQQAKVLEQHIQSLEEEQQAFDSLFREGLGDGQRARELNRSVLQLQNELTRINSESARLAIQATENEIQLASLTQDYLKEVGERIRERQTELFTTQEQLRVAEDRLKRATIRSPEPGVIVNLQVHTIGGVIPSGQPLVELVPREDQFVIEARISPQDIDNIYQGQIADIRFSAFSSRFTRVIEAEMDYISADRLESERDGAPYYLARLRLSPEDLQELADSNLELKAGMPAEVMIRGESRTLYSYLIKPLTDHLSRGMREY